MANEGVNVPIDGNPTGFRRAMQEVIQSSKDSAKGIENAFAPLEKVFSGVQGKIAAIGAVLAGGAAFRDMINTTAKFGEESIKLGRALGISATEASLLKEALDANESSQEEFIGTAQKLAKQVRNNEEEINKMGLATRDAHGKLRPLNELMLDSISVLNGYKQGTDRAIAAQVLYGKGFELTSNLVNINKKSVAELADLQRELGAVVGAENVTAWQAFDDAGDKANLTLKAMKIAIGNALLPALTDMGNWFTSIGPAAVTAIKGAFGGLVATFHLVTTGVTVLWETINAMVVTVAEPIRALGVSISKALSGDWSGAASEIRNIGSVISGAWGKAFDEMAIKAQTTRDKIWNLFAAGSDAAAPGTGGKSAAGLVKKEDKKDKAGPDSYMPTYEAALAEKKNQFEQENVLRQFSKQQELAYWRELTENYQVTAKDKLAIAKRTSILELEIRRDLAKQQLDLDAVTVSQAQAAAEAQVALDQARAQAELDNGLTTKEQFLAQEEQFEARRHEIALTALAQRIALAEKDPTRSPAEIARLYAEVDQLDNQHQIKRIQMSSQMAQESGQIWKDLGERMSGLWDKGVQALMNGTLTWKNGMQAVGAEVVGWFARDVVGKQVKLWIMGEATKTGATQTGLAVRGAAEAAAALKSVGLWAMTAVKNIMTSAWEAMAAAWKAVAGIPIIGPFLAPVVAGAAFLGVSSLAKNVMSAEGGYDIPRGINPLTQLHEQEMVLPKKEANVIRDMADGGGTSTGAGAMNITVKAMDSKDVLRALQDGGVLHTALGQLHRNFRGK